MARHILFFDGASRGNPGHASAAFVIFNELLGKVVFSAGRYLGKETNNVAEYTGLIDGLRKARDENLLVSAVRGDSKLVISQVKGVWRIKKPHLAPLCAMARDLGAGVESWEWIPRAENHLANACCNEVLEKFGGAPSLRRKASRSPRGSTAVLSPPRKSAFPRSAAFPTATQEPAMFPEEDKSARRQKKSRSGEWSWD